MNIKVLAVVVVICVTGVTAKYPGLEKIKLLKRLLASQHPANNGGNNAVGGDASNMSPQNLLMTINEKLDTLNDKVGVILQTLFYDEEDEETAEGTSSPTTPPTTTTDSGDTATTTTVPPADEETTTSESQSNGNQTTNAGTTESPTTTSESTVERRLLLSLLKNLARKRTQRYLK